MTVRFVQSATRSSASSTTWPISTSLPADDALRLGGEAADLDRHASSDRPLVAAFVGVHDRPRQPEFVRDFFGDHQADRAGVHDPFDGRPSDLGFAAMSSVHQWRPCWFHGSRHVDGCLRAWKAGAAPRFGRIPA